MTELYLLKNIKLDTSYNFTIDVEDEETQHSYFLNLVDTDFLINDDYKFVRKGSVKLPANYDSIELSNYLMYNNKDKWYYCFITHKEYVNKDTTRVEYEVDVMQTYMFDYTIEESFIEREHQDRFTSEGKPIYSITKENIEVGDEYEVKTRQEIPDPFYWVEVLCTTYVGDGSTDFSYLYSENGIQGVYVYFIPIRKDGVSFIKSYYYDGTLKTIETNNSLSAMLNTTAVISIKVLPYSPVKYTFANDILTITGGYTSTPLTNPSHFNTLRLCKYLNTNFGGENLAGWGSNYYAFGLEGIDNIYDNSIIYSEQNNLLSYTTPSYLNTKSILCEPKVNIYPYSFVRITDSQSQPLDARYENIPNNIVLKFIQSFSPQHKHKLYIENYLYDYGKFTNLSNNSTGEIIQRTDSYLDYISNNKASAQSGAAINLVTAAVALGVGAVTGGVGLVAGIAGGMAMGQQAISSMQQEQNLKSAPDGIRQMGNNIYFDIRDNNITFSFYIMSIKNEYINRLFNLFFHYGYVCNDFKKPNIRSRYYFNYIKTIGVNIHSNIDNEHIIKISNIYNTGITIWHYRNALTFKGINNYEYENQEISLIGE